MKNIPFLVFISFSYLLSAQKHTISGFITDVSSGEVLIGATVYAPTPEKGMVTNNYGFYSISVNPLDSLVIVFSYLGYEPQIKIVQLTSDLRLDVKLEPSAVGIKEVVVSVASDLSDRNVSRIQPGIIDIPVAKIRELPAILGEKDVLKIVQLLPGVQAGNEGTTGFYVRGGNADQNLVQLDEAVVYNPNHLFGLFSTFNSRALNHVDLIKGGFPAQYGGRLSSILDITMKEGNSQKFKTEGGIGLITSQLTVEGPLVQDKASFILSGRRTYLDLLARALLPKSNESNYNFYDLNAKLNWRVTSKDRIFFSAFRGRDAAKYKEAAGIQYDLGFGNSTATLRWNHLFSPKLFANSSFIFNTYDNELQARQYNSGAHVISSIQDLNGKLEFQYYPSTAHSIRMGIYHSNHTFLSAGQTGSLVKNQLKLIDKNKIPQKKVNEWAGYINDEWKWNDRISTNIGIRLPGFNSRDTSYFRIEPRVSLNVMVSEKSSIKFSYSGMNQFLHLIPSSTASVPNDIWIPSSEKTLPQISRQLSLGYFHNFKTNAYETSIELYHKTMDHQVLFREGNQLIQSLDVDDLLEYGQGKSYGAEFFIRKNAGKLTGWISYTLSKTDQQFEALNFGEKFPFRYDRRHNLALTGNLEITDRWSVSSTFVYTSGSVYTLPISRIPAHYGGSIFEGNYFIYEGRNNARMAAYHRLDLSISYKKPRCLFGKKYDSEWVIGLYNSYSRLNPYFIYFAIDPVTNQPQAKQVSLLPIIPSVNYNFKF